MNQQKNELEQLADLWIDIASQDDSVVDECGYATIAGACTKADSDYCKNECAFRKAINE